MRIIGVFMMFAASAFVQVPPAVASAVCGSEKITFDVKLDDSHHAAVQPEPGKAEVYFIQDKGVKSFGIGGTVVSMVGIDGAWAGENKNNSYFSVPVEPGEHHVCARVQPEHLTELSHFTAEAGKVYYFRERIVPTGYGLYLFFDSVDSDQAKSLIASFPRSLPNLKK